MGEQEHNGFKLLLKDPSFTFQSSKDISRIVHILYVGKRIFGEVRQLKIVFRIDFTTLCGVAVVA